MTKRTLRSAIAMGVHRSEGKGPDSIIDSVQDAVEMAFALEQEISASHAPEPAPVPREPVTSIAELPANPESAIEMPEIQDYNPPAQEVEQDYSPVPVPPPPEKPLIVLARNEHDIDREQAVQAMEARSASRIRTTMLRKPNRVKSEDVMKWAGEAFPAKVRIIPEGLEEPITLEKDIQFFPMSGAGKGAEAENVVKIAYKHPSVSADLAVGVHVRVGDCQKEWPDPKELLKTIAKQAQVMYKPRPKTIEGRAPTTPGLQDNLRMVTSQLKEQQKGQAEGQRRRPVDAQITFSDADAPLLR